jgi:hypothetical protein
MQFNRLQTLKSSGRSAVIASPHTFYIRRQGGRPEYSKSDQIKYVLTSDAASMGSTAALLSAAARGEIRKKIGDMGCVAAMEHETRDK